MLTNKNPAGYSKLVSIARVQPGEIILEVGCGNGNNLVQLASLVGKRGIVIGIDGNLEALYQSRGLLMKEEVTNVSLLRNYIVSKLPIKDTTIDVIIANQLIEHRVDLKMFFKEIYRVLKFKGRVIITDILNQKLLSDAGTKNLNTWMEYYAGTYNREEYFRIIKSSGFEIACIHEEFYYKKNGYQMCDITYSLLKTK
jgi:arsenite methyltransferase